MNINKIICSGRLTKAPELKALPSGTSVCELRLAVDGRGRGREVGYVNVSVFGSGGEAAAGYLAKGWLVAIDGRLEYGEWEVEGAERQDYSVVGNAEFLTSPRRIDEPEAAKPARKKSGPVAVCPRTGPGKSSAVRRSAALDHIIASALFIAGSPHRSSRLSAACLAPSVGCAVAYPAAFISRPLNIGTVERIHHAASTSHLPVLLVLHRRRPDRRGGDPALDGSCAARRGAARARAPGDRARGCPGNRISAGPVGIPRGFSIGECECECASARWRCLQHSSWCAGPFPSRVEVRGTVGVGGGRERRAAVK